MQTVWSPFLPALFSNKLIAYAYKGVWRSLTGLSPGHLMAPE